MKLSIFFDRAVKAAKSNAPEILTAVGVSGVVTTSYLVGKASFQAAKTLDEASKEAEVVIAGVPYPQEFGIPVKEKIKIVWKLYIPATVSGVVTIGCIIASSKSSGRRTAAAVTAYSLTERAYSEYKEKVVEQLGKTKEQKIRDEIAQDRVTKNPPESKEVVILGGGDVLCCELWTGRYFKSDMESLRRAENDLNAMIVNTYYVSLDEFYDLLELPHTSNSDKMGWDSDKLLELQFSTVMSPDGTPCLAFEYNYLRPNHRSIMS